VVEVVGEAGTAHTASWGSPVLRRDQTLSQRIESDWLERFRTAYVIEMQRWIEDLRKGQLTGPNVWDGYMSLVTVESCISSLESGSPQRSPIPERPALYQEFAEVER
jgi:myo-inositol 2-dehydrogenase/D-chiro-inositol 1-dehydrogenase